MPTGRNRSIKNPADRRLTKTLDLNNRSVLPYNPRQAFRDISSAFLCLPKLFTSIPGLTRVLALIEDVDGRTTAAEDLRVVLIDRTFGIADSWDIFDDDDVVGMFTLGVLALGSGNERLVKEAVVDHVVAEMVVGGDGQRLDTGVGSTTPGTNMFWGAPLMKGSPSRIAATARRVDEETSK